MSQALKKNIQTFFEKSPLSGKLLKNLNPRNFQWTPTQTKEGEHNLEKEGQSLYSSYSAKRETERFLSPQSLPHETQAICIYGVGLGYTYDYLIPWLAKDNQHRLILIEKDIEILYHLFQEERAESILKHPQVDIMHILPDMHIDELSEYIACRCIGLRVELIALPFYERTDTEYFVQLRDQFYLKALMINYVSIEFLAPSEQVISNLYHNLLKLHQAKIFQNQHSPFQNLPAIICGAGPSIEKQLPLIKSLKDRALIFAGGSAVNALTGHGIIPHFGGTVDPNEEQLLRMRAHHAFTCPFLFTSRTHRDVLNKLSGELIYLPYEIGYYKVHSWLHEAFGIKPLPPYQGISIPHILTTLATQLNCNPIIFVGLDRAYTANKLYTSGVISNEQIPLSDLKNNQAFIQEKDVNGHPVYTKWDWLTEVQMHENFIKENPKTTFINATGGGLPIQGTQNMPLKEVVKKHLRHTRDLEGKVHLFIQKELQASLQSPKLQSFFRDVLKSLQISISLSEHMQNQIDRLITTLNKGDEASAATLSKSIRSSRKKLEQEPAFEYILGPVDFAQKFILNRRFDTLGNEETKSTLRKKCKLAKEEVTFFKDCAEANQSILENLLPKT